MSKQPAGLAVVVVCLGILGSPAFSRAQSSGQALQEIKVTARRFQFEPRSIAVKKGQPVRLTITATEADHGFAISELGINQKIKANSTSVIEFTPTRSGTFKFSCSVYCGEGHEEMTGELVVSDEQAASPTQMNVEFPEGAPGVVIVSANGERLRIDTRDHSVTKLEESTALPPKAQAIEPERKSTAQTEPYDYRLVNVPTPKRVLRGSLNLYFTHRFSEPLRPLSQSGKDLLGLDSFAVPSFGVFYGVTDKLYVNFYRSPVCQQGLCRTIELGAGYHWLDEKGDSPVALSTYASVEGDDNFQNQFTYNLQAMLARSITRYVNVFFSPALHLNANAQRRFDPHPEDFFPPLPLANQFNQPKHGGSFGFGVNGRVRPTVSLLFEYTPRVGFKLGRVRPVFAPGTHTIIGFRTESEAELGFGVEKDIGRHSFSITFSNTQTTTTSRYNSSNLVLSPSHFIIGFNLYRRFLR